MTIKKPGKLFKGLPKKLRVWNSHGDRLIKLPAGFVAIGTTENSEYAAIEDTKRSIYGIQFHPEVFHTERGVDILRNFLTVICKAKQDWTTKDYIAHSRWRRSASRSASPASCWAFPAASIPQWPRP